MAAAEKSDSTADMFLRPTETPSLPNVFFVGPYGHRVSFASQQRRALNTVWALFDKKRLKTGSSVAVVGAGVAGLTLAAALLSKGCVVQLFEKEASPLLTQKDAKHRILHPTINFWPGQSLKPDTQFPFFDWATGRCDKIIASFIDEWFGDKARPFKRSSPSPAKSFHDRLQRFHPNTEIENLIADSGQVEVVTTKIGGKPLTFEAVFVAIGFGLEDDVPGTQGGSYWKPEQPRYLEDVAASNLCSFLVSGTGDGGLIDTLRILFDGFEHGELAIDLAMDLSEANLAPKIIKVEDDAAREKKGDDAARVLSAGYRDFVASDMPEAMLKHLKAALRTIPGREVLLVGQVPEPFKKGAAPIHKVLIAVALESKALVYEQSDLTSGASGLTLTPVVGAPKPIVPDHAIARHGSDRPLERFIPDEDERNDLMRRQSDFSDLLEGRAIERDFFDQKGAHPPLDPTDLGFVRSRRPKADAYVHERFGLHVSVGGTTTAPYLEVSNPDVDEFDASTLPETMFGIQVIATHRMPTRSAVGRPSRG